MPDQHETTLVHGDYRLGNVMLDERDTGRIVAVFDWEMSTLGDPLSDLGYALLWWGTNDRVPVHPSQAVADLAGFPTADELIDGYEAATGHDVADVEWYVALAAFKLAVIHEGQRATRRRAGQAVEDASGQPLAEWALEKAGVGVAEERACAGGDALAELPATGEERPAPRELLRELRADPDHMAEHFALFAVARLREESRRYA